MTQIAGTNAEHVGTDPERSGLEADGEIITSGVGPPRYAPRRQRRADVRCPTTHHRRSSAKSGQFGWRIYEEARRPLVMISPSASSPDLSGVSPYMFRVCPSDLSHGTQLARYARHMLSAQRVGVIYLDDDYGRGLRLSFTAEFKRLAATSSKQIRCSPPRPASSRTSPPAAGGGCRCPDARDRPCRGGARTAGDGADGCHWTTLGGDALSGHRKERSIGRGCEDVRRLPRGPDR